MKQKIFYIVLVIVGMHLPASSRECGKVIKVEEVTDAVVKTSEPATDDAQDVSVLPASPFSTMLFNL